MKSFRVGLVLLSGLLLWGALICACAETIAKMPAPTGYVDDYAGVLSAPANAELEGLCNELHDKTRAQIFFVTVKTLDGEPVERFANELFAKWKIGEKKTDRGVLLLLATDEHRRWIEVGYGFEGILNDAKVGDIGREMVPALKASDYDGAARIGVRDVATVIAADAGVTLAGLGDTQSQVSTEPALPTDTATTETTDSTNADGSQGGIFSAVVFIVIYMGLFITMLRMRGKVARGGGYNGSGGFSSGGGFGSGGGGFGGGFGGGGGGASGGGGAGGGW